MRMNIAGRSDALGPQGRARGRPGVFVETEVVVSNAGAPGARGATFRAPVRDQGLCRVRVRGHENIRKRVHPGGGRRGAPGCSD